MTIPSRPDHLRPGSAPCDDALAAEWSRPRAMPPAEPACDRCGTPLTSPFGWCVGCRKAFCFGCGRQHYCKPSCQANGCMAGLCVRVFSGGLLSDRWGLPAE